MIKTKELRGYSQEQLENLIIDLEKEIFDLKNQLATARKLEKPHLIREKKKTKARVLTLLEERKGGKSGSEK